MSFTKTCRKLCCFIAFVLAFCFLVGCTTVNPTPSERETNKKAAEEAVAEIKKGLLWDPTAMNAITTAQLTLTTETKYKDDDDDNIKVVISWESSDEEIIAKDGSVTRVYFEDERAVLVDNVYVTPVTLTATITGTYSYKSGEETITNEVVDTKTFNFTVKCTTEKVKTIAECKAEAWNYIFVEKGLPKALSTNDSGTSYAVNFTAVVTGKLLNGGMGIMVHDGTEGIYIYGNNTEVEVGDTVSVIGDIYTYYGSLQLGSKSTVKKVDPVAGMKVGEYREITVQEWEDEQKDVEKTVGYYGGKLLKVYGKLVKSSNPSTSDIYKLIDAITGEEAWIYYKSYAKDSNELDAWNGKYVYAYGVSYDRDSRLNKNHLLWNGKIEEAPTPELTDAEKVATELAGISVPAEAKEDFELAASENYLWEVVSGTAIALDGNKATVTRGEEDEVVVLKVTVTIGSESASKEFEVTVKKLVKETPKHAGTKEDPYTVSDAVLVAGSLADKEVTEQVYAIGMISAIKEVNAQYGNATFTITDGNKELIVFRAKYLNNEKFTSEDQIKVGDVVIIVGQLTNYGGTLEFNSGCYIDSFSEEELPVEGNGSLENPYTVEQALEICAGLADKEVTEQVYVIGTISSIKEVSAQYGNATFNIGDLVVFRAKYLNNEKFTSEDQIKVGDVVIIVGQLTNYGGTLEFNSGCYIQAFVNGETPEQPEQPEKTEYTIAEALELADGAAVILKGTVDRVEAWNDQYGNMNFTLKDATGALYVYRVYTKVALGDIVTVEGTMATYNESRQIGQGATITITGHDSSYDVVVENAVTYDFSTYAVGTQYAQGEEHKLDENTTLTVNGGHLNGQVRIYAGSNVVLSSSKAMTTLSIYAGNKNTTLTVTASVDGETWVEIVVLSITSAYADHEIDLSGAAYKYVKLTADAQVRVKTATISYAE